MIMVMLKKSCCGLSLKTGSIIVIYSVLTQEVLTLFVLTIGPKETSRSLFVRNESDSALYLQIWIVVFNIFVVLTALYAIYKQRPPLMIPFLAYRTVNLIFSVFTLLSARDIANTLNESLENSVHNERDEIFDTLPFVIIGIIILMCIELYLLLIVYSYYQSLIINMTVVAVAVPVLAYTVPTCDNANVYAQPPVNPYLFEAKNVYQYQESYTSPGVQYYHTQPNATHFYNPTTTNETMPQPPPPYGQ